MSNIEDFQEVKLHKLAKNIKGQRNVMIEAMFPVAKSSDSRGVRWLVKCDCGEFKVLPIHDFEKTKSCGCLLRKNGLKSHRYKGYQDIYAQYWLQVVRGARDRKLEFSITMKDVWDLYIKQNRKCALTGWDIHFTKYRDEEVKGQTASLDRIDSKRGYTIDNIQLLHKDVHRTKWTLTTERHLEVCKAITEYQLSKGDK